MKKLVSLAGYVGLFLLLAISPAYACMHIMEGFLPVGHAIFWGVVCLPFLIIGIKKLSSIRLKDKRVLIILAMSGAFAFTLSALKIPSVTGSSSHPTGMGLVAILFGPFAASVIGVIILFFQAVLLAHGGLTTLGANTFSMGIVGPLVSYGLFKVLKGKAPKSFRIFIASALGALSTYVVTAVQLAFAHPQEVGGVMASFTKFFGIFAVTQVPLAIIEGLLTMVLLSSLESLAKEELNLIGYLEA
ncbi:energy-coupling factor ABC transporter permease [Citroniella saccharovorans]|uniref:Cobalt transport protein CbiM n=1 Tax=Citroniella saccharovorans TaxID=2053367 RepID=A0AAW9MSX7_9FIRM|nr:energy-coupling factor ABC transporter permease [Citroniella saccharovorans]MEB3428988.1 energy-coupling factor ABC transporter permease [Citroniella saccharovorans]